MAIDPCEVPFGHSRKVLRTFRDLDHTSFASNAPDPRVVGALRGSRYYTSVASAGSQRGVLLVAESAEHSRRVSAPWAETSDVAVKD
jgi:hypothetical protein